MKLYQIIGVSGLGILTLALAVLFFFAVWDTTSKKQPVITEVKTEKGVECVFASYKKSVSLECNFEKYNDETNFGKFPYATRGENKIEVE